MSPPGSRITAERRRRSPILARPRTGTKARPLRPAPASAVAGDALREYADRGVFRGFSRQPRRGGGEEVSFRWLADSIFRVRLDPRSRRLVFADLLPNVPYRSPMDRAFRDFVRGRADAALPEHRRIDPRRVALGCSNRDGTVSVTLALRRRGAAREAEDWRYAARKGVSLVNEIFHGFLSGPYYDYMVRNFNQPEE
jgi:hypothetical protein